MPHHDDQAYYSKRAVDEIDHGDQAANASVAAIHYELARRYSLLAFFMNDGKLALVDGGTQKIAA